MAVLFFRFDFPLRLRLALWVYLGVFLATFPFIDPVAAGVVLGAYLVFTVLMWGTVYYHLRIGTPWTNGLRFWRLVLENPDPTSGNFQEQMPKLLILVLGVTYLTQNFEVAPIVGLQAFTVFVALSALLVHQWFFRWVPPLPQSPAPSPKPQGRISRRFIVIAIDGCRADRLLEAQTPFIDRLRAEGTDFRDMSTVYPARTVTCFSSMLTGAGARTHGMHSNFVPRLSVKCDSVFAALRREGLHGKLVGIAHLIDAFGDDVRTVTAVMDNDEIDDALIEQAKQVMRDDDPDLLVLQLLSVDQTGHARGSYFPEYLRKIEDTDRKIENFVAWCREQGYLDEGTLLITADHGQGIGIGGHGHMSPTEITIPCVLWGAGVESSVRVDEPRSIVDIAPTITHYLGVEPPQDSVGSPLLAPREETERPVVFVIPAHDEAANLPQVLQRIATTAPQGHRVVVVDDGSTDETAAVAESLGALVVRHERNRGLGAALRTGLRTARALNASAAVYLDADGEYDASEAGRLLGPIQKGEADYVLGTRSEPEGMTLARRVANICFSALLSLA
ncbi:MAG TPA: glycosyltransferase, partial [Dehalococcoidia bacterium]|nr:glycosyltransferase [Dehalococcoidia bacterium]